MVLAVERRTTARTPTIIRVENRDGGPTLFAHDVSLGGMMVTSQDPLWPGTLVRVRFKLPGDARCIRVTCRVVDFVEVPRGVGMALQFLRLALPAQLALHRFVDRRPMPLPEDDSSVSEVGTWVSRIVEDCQQLKALAQF